MNLNRELENAIQKNRWEPDTPSGTSSHIRNIFIDTFKRYGICRDKNSVAYFTFKRKIDPKTTFFLHIAQTSNEGATGIVLQVGNHLLGFDEFAKEGSSDSDLLECTLISSPDSEDSINDAFKNINCTYSLFKKQVSS